MNQENDFKVVDKRASSGATDADPKEKPGPGFTMPGFTTKEIKEKPAEPARDAVDFPTFMFSLATGAFIHLGLAPDPVTGKTEKNLDLARQNIDILRMLRDKTKGNLSPDENKMLEGLLAETQLRFVEVSKKS